MSPLLGKFYHILRSGRQYEIMDIMDIIPDSMIDFHSMKSLRLDFTSGKMLTAQLADARLPHPLHRAGRQLVVLHVDTLLRLAAGRHLPKDCVLRSTYIPGQTF